MNKSYVGLLSLSFLISQPAHADRLSPGARCLDISVITSMPNA